MGWRGGWGGIRLPTRRQGKQNTAAPVALTLVVRQGFKITKLRSAGGNWVTGSFGEKSKLTELKSKRFPH